MTLLTMLNALPLWQSTSSPPLPSCPSKPISFSKFPAIKSCVFLSTRSCASKPTLRVRPASDRVKEQRAQTYPSRIEARVCPFQASTTSDANTTPWSNKTLNDVSYVTGGPASLSTLRVSTLPQYVRQWSPTSYACPTLQRTASAGSE